MREGGIREEERERETNRWTDRMTNRYTEISFVYSVFILYDCYFEREPHGASKLQFRTSQKSYLLTSTKSRIPGIASDKMCPNLCGISTPQLSS